ncbi:MAG: tetratricopeptide repeat protein [Burkholderiaceae bacterium]|nr:tetratricopeptide repeat protein [Burkholderiaceae bacterium]
MLALAGWYVGNNQAKDAIPMLQEALATKPDDIQLLDALGTAYLRSDQETLGMETLEKILRAKPDNAALQMRMGQFKLSRNDTTGALANFRRAAELQPKAVEPKVAIAAVLARTGKVDEARAVATALQKEQPANPAGPLLEGDIAMSQRKFPEAAAADRKALASARALPKATAAAQLPIHIKLHQATLGAGNLSEADGMLRSMVKDAPDNLALRNYAAEHEIARRRWAEAIAHYQVVVEKQPNNPLALNNMAWAMHEAKDPKALETAEKALALAPKAPAVLDTVGVILVAAGKADRGIDLMRQAVSIDPKAPALRLHLAEALIGKGDAGSARKEIDAVLAANPDGPAAQSARELIKRLERPGN